MASETSIVNRALDELGARPIVSLTDGTENANLASRNYDEVRDGLLAEANWNFAMERAKLARLDTDPISGFNYRYQLPSNYVRLTAVYDNDDDAGSLRYKLEDDSTLHSDAEEVYIRYVRRVEDPNAMSPSFRKALSLRLAAVMAVPVTNSLSVLEAMEAKAERAVRRAKSSDAIQDYPAEFPAGSWITGRNR